MSISSSVSGVNTDFVTSNFVNGAAFSDPNLVISWYLDDVRLATTLTITITAQIAAVSTFTQTTSFDLVTTLPTCANSPESITITPSTMAD